MGSFLARSRTRTRARPLACLTFPGALTSTTSTADERKNGVLSCILHQKKDPYRINFRVLHPFVCRVRVLSGKAFAASNQGHAKERLCRNSPIAVQTRHVKVDVSGCFSRESEDLFFSGRKKCPQLCLDPLPNSGGEKKGGPKPKGRRRVRQPARSCHRRTASTPTARPRPRARRCLRDSPTALCPWTIRKGRHDRGRLPSEGPTSDCVKRRELINK